MIKNGEYYLITTDNWFTAPDGERYCAVWGKTEIKTTEEIFNFTPKRPSTNWFIIVGKEESKQIIIAGCQIHFAIRCNERPFYKMGTYLRNEKTDEELPYNNIYFTE